MHTTIVVLLICVLSLSLAEVTRSSMEYLLKLGADTGLSPSVQLKFKEDLERINGCDDKCACPFGYAMLIDTTGAVTCRRLCFKSSVLCGATVPATIGACQGNDIIALSECTIFQPVAPGICTTGFGVAPCADALVILEDQQFCLAGTSFNVTSGTCPCNFQSQCVQVLSVTCGAFNSDPTVGYADIQSIPCVDCGPKPCDPCPLKPCEKPCEKPCPMPCPLPLPLPCPMPCPMPEPPCPESSNPFEPIEPCPLRPRPCPRPSRRPQTSPYRPLYNEWDSSSSSSESDTDSSRSFSWDYRKVAV